MKSLAVHIILMMALIPFAKSQQADSLYLENDDLDGLIPLVWEYSSDWDSAHILRKNTDLDNPQFQIIKSVLPPQSTYTDTALCTQDARYFMRFFNVPDTAISNTVFTDEDDPPPDRLIVDSITVTNENKITIGWQKSMDKTCRGYVIFDESLQKYDTIFNPNETNYVFPDTLKPKQQTYNYFVIAIDGIINNQGNYCNSSTPIDFTNLQGTILIKDINYDICTQQTEITFEGYNTNEIVATNQQTEKYYLLRRDITSGGPMQKIDSSDAVTTFTNSVEPNRTYEYLIRAKLTSHDSEPATSSSARKTITTRQIPQPDKPSIASASVEGRSIELNGIVDSTGFAQGYKLMRHSENEENFERTLDTIPADHRVWELPDETALPSDKSYYYKLVTIDSCGNDTTESNITRTIHLEINSPDNNTNELSWNHYKGWEADYDYLVYRYENSGQPDKKITVLDNSRDSYTDDDFRSLFSGQWHYRVKAAKTENARQQNDSAWSNEVKASQKTQLELPNAFKPSSNSYYEFPPEATNIATNINPEGYSLKIFNRWGALIFESNTPAKGWEGYYNGEKAPAGTYVYVLQYKNQNNDIVHKKGTVTLIR